VSRRPSTIARGFQLGTFSNSPSSFFNSSCRERICAVARWYRQHLGVGLSQAKERKLSCVVRPNPVNLPAVAIDELRLTSSGSTPAENHVQHFEESPALVSLVL
jgi:hypothetical protein